MKSRGQDYEGGQHSLAITTGKGLEVFRRVQLRARGIPVQPTSDQRSPIGCAPLDALIGGGIYDGSTTMVVGISGSGKTVLGVQLLLEGAMKQGKRGMLVSLDEHPAQILRNAATLGMDLKEQIDQGMIQVGLSLVSRCDLGLLPGGVIPDFHRSAHGGHGAALSIGRPGHDGYRVCMHERWPVFVSCSSIPDLHGPVSACRGDLCAIR